MATGFNIIASVCVPYHIFVIAELPVSL